MEEVFNPWTESEEQILKKWADKSSCYKIMHDRSYKKYWSLNAWFVIPVIIFSTITGAGNLSLEGFPEVVRLYVFLLLGFINISSAIITTIGQFMRTAQTMEGHRLSAIAWGKFSRKIKVQLAKSRNTRMSVDILMSDCQEEYDRLVEISPNISTDVLRWFKKIVKSGDYKEDIRGCHLCVYETFCFPFGIDSCVCRCIPDFFFKTRKERRESKRKANILELQDMEFPEILGRLKPAQISSGDNDNEYSVYASNVNP